MPVIMSLTENGVRLLKLHHKKSTIVISNKTPDGGASATSGSVIVQTTPEFKGASNG